MRVQWAVPVIASILILGTLGISYDAIADPGENEGNNSCENSNPNSKACESNPNAITETCESCLAKYNERNIVCEGNFECLTASHEALKACVNSVSETCSIPPAPAP